MRNSEPNTEADSTDSIAHSRRLPGWYPVWLDRRVLSFASYDIASSVYFGVVPTVIFPFFFFSSANHEANRFLWLGIGVSIALLVAGLIAPFMGRYADRTNTRWIHLAFLTVLNCAFTCLLAFAGLEHPWLTLSLFACAQIAYYLAQPLYESYLPSIAGSKDFGRVSAFGWATGFLGGIAVIFALLPITAHTSSPPFAKTFLVAGGIFTVLSIIALALLRRNVPEGDSTPAPTRTSVIQTVRKWKVHSQFFRVVLAFYLVNTALVTISVFAAGYFSAVFGSSLHELLILMLIYTLVALPSTMFFGVVADRYSHEFAISVSIAIWICAVVLMATGRGSWVPTAAVALLGLVFGSTLSLFRSLIAQLVPRGREAEFFGFNTAAGRVSASVGPVLFGLITSITGDPRFALLSMVVFVLVGIAALPRNKLGDGVPT